jgi:hypothetical protein
MGERQCKRVGEIRRPAEPCLDLSLVLENKLARPLGERVCPSLTFHRPAPRSPAARRRPESNHTPQNTPPPACSPSQYVQRRSFATAARLPPGHDAGPRTSARLKRTTRRTGFLDVNQKFKSAPGREIASPTPAVRIALKWQPLPEGTPILTTTGLASNSIQVDRFRGRIDIPNRGSNGARRARGRGHSDLGDKGSA